MYLGHSKDHSSSRQSDSRRWLLPSKATCRSSSRKCSNRKVTSRLFHRLGKASLAASPDRCGTAEPAEQLFSFHKPLATHQKIKEQVHTQVLVGIWSDKLTRR